ncbi:calcium binding egf domain-containing protein, partial [Cystoisospora suis]
SLYAFWCIEIVSLDVLNSRYLSTIYSLHLSFSLSLYLFRIDACSTIGGGREGSSSFSSYLCLDEYGRSKCPSSLHCLHDGTCGCAEGYRRIKDTCEDIDECLEGLAVCASSSLARCVNTEGGYFCSCREGYEGDGRQCVKSPSVLQAKVVITTDYRRAIEQEEGEDNFVRLLTTSLAQAIPGLKGDRIEVLRVSEGSIILIIRIHPPRSSSSFSPFSTSQEGSFSSSPSSSTSAGGMDDNDEVYVHQQQQMMSSAEVLLALQNQLENPSSPLRTGPFGEYASLTTIGNTYN